MISIGGNDRESTAIQFARSADGVITGRAVKLMQTYELVPDKQAE